MKKYLILFVLVNTIFHAKSYAQITPAKSGMYELTSKVSQPYDSTRNFLGTDVNQYIGQELYVLPQSEDFRKYGYRDFVVDYKKTFPDDKTNLYKLYNKSTKYEAVAGRYFKVLDVYKHPHADQDYYLAGKFFLKLQAKDTKEILYYEYDPKYESTFPFLVMGYYEKMKKINVGKNFILRGNNWWSTGKTIKDLDTGVAVDLSKGDTWKCIDFIVDEKYYTTEYLLENENKKHIPIRIQDINNTKYVFEESKAAAYKNKYGAENWNKILEGVVKIGWDKEMCRLSWGEPKQVHVILIKGKRNEQWVYEDENLYFDNDHLAVIH
ncbi:hypothetical protein GXP67_27775 [Rhodocytophaga rosea]|uniref:Uncharacterized protein n=1 Tax=Rhodocytophaga rosea TaxID=2704465 RepID=A0A6C0GQN9_9BACT|nr:hypothetical protein [Rhodocytophaga rosea]QHT70174.1 hypothetical protein GXP67_27775 [Rhodocytophaga rosea]